MTAARGQPARPTRCVSTWLGETPIASANSGVFMARSETCRRISVSAPLLMASSIASPRRHLRRLRQTWHPRFGRTPRPASRLP